MKSLTRSVLAAAALAAFSSASVHALSATSTVNVSASVAPVCTINTGSLAFGAYDPLAATSLDGTGAFTIACAKGTTYSVGLGLGSNASGSARRMSDGATTASFLGYEIYSDAGRSTVWGTTSGTVGSTAASKAAITLNMYGRISAGQDVPTGNYTDSVVSTVNF